MITLTDVEYASALRQFASEVESEGSLTGYRVAEIARERADEVYPVAPELTLESVVLDDGNDAWQFRTTGWHLASDLRLKVPTWDELWRDYGPLKIIYDAGKEE